MTPLSYGSLCTEFYDLDKPVAPAEAVAFYLAQAREAGGRVLEPMCGSGRFLLPLLRAGVAIEGTDASLAMLDACRRRMREEGLHAGLHEQSLETLDLLHRYSMAFVPAGSIGLLAADGALRCALSALRRHLEPGARLYLELADVDDDAGESRPPPRVVRGARGETIGYDCIVSRRRDPDALVFAGTYEKREGERLVAREEETLVLRRFRIDEIVASLAAAGFGDARVVGAGDLSWLADGGCTLVVAS